MRDNNWLKYLDSHMYRDDNYDSEGYSSYVDTCIDQQQYNAQTTYQNWRGDGISELERLEKQARDEQLQKRLSAELKKLSTFTKSGRGGSGHVS